MLRAWYQILGAPTYYQKVDDPQEAHVVIDSIADFVNYMVDAGVFPDHCSSAGLEEFDEEDNEWVEWYDEDGCDIHDNFNEEADDEV